MIQELSADALDAREETHQTRQGGQTVEVAIVTKVRKDGHGLTLTKRNLTFKDGLLVDQGKEYQVRTGMPSTFG